MTIRIKNWSKLQHFKDRTPPWIKLYRDLLDDPDWHDLDGETAKILIGLWLIASEDEHKEGTLPDTRKLAFRLRLDISRIERALTRLSHWLEQDDITMISSGYQVDAPETETETKKEGETYPPLPPKGEKKRTYQKKELPTPPEEYLEHLSTICRDWPRHTTYNERKADVTILSRPADLWQRILKFCPGEDPKLPINCAIRYLDVLDQRPKDYEGLIPNVCAMTNFFGEKALWKNMIDKVNQ